jgi:hypothetical protein
MIGGVTTDEAVVATYREIAERFGLASGPKAGRLKAVRAGWPIEPEGPSERKRTVAYCTQSYG